MCIINFYFFFVVMKNDVIIIKGGGVSMVGKYCFIYGRLWVVKLVVCFFCIDIFIVWIV